MVSVVITGVGDAGAAPLDQRYTLTYSNKETSTHSKEEIVNMLSIVLAADPKVHLALGGDASARPHQLRHRGVIRDEFVRRREHLELITFVYHFLLVGSGMHEQFLHMVTVR